MKRLLPILLLVFSVGVGADVLTLRSNVEGDKVYIDGQYKGSTRLDLTLPKGRYNIEVWKSGYTPYFKAIDLRGDLIIWAKLKPLKAVQKASYPKNSPEWVREQAEQGNANEQNSLGMFYRFGFYGFPKDDVQAMRWFEKALMQENRLGAWNAAVGYLMGEGIPANYVAAYAYASIAQALGGNNDRSLADIQETFGYTFNEYERANGQAMAAQIWEKIKAAKSGESSGSQPIAKERGSTGTGFFINHQGHVITNSHVVEECIQINILHGGARVNTTLVSNDPRNDLALLKVSTRPNAIAYFRSGRGIRAGEDILAFGYPLQSMLSDDLKGTKGMINALSGFDNDTRMMQMSAPIQPGNSGGPLLDQAGNVVGVVTAKMNAVKMAKHTGDIPQNVNFALKASLVRDMLEVKDIDYETASSKKELKTVDIFDKARKFTVLVECLQ